MHIKKDYHYYKKAFQGLSMPFAYIDLDYFEENIRQIEQRTQGKYIRVASKSMRCRSLIQKVLEASAKFEGVMSFTASETAYLSRCGLDNLLLAYPTVDQTAIEEVCHEVRQGKIIYLMVDSIEQANLLDRLGRKHQVVLSLCIDVDMSTDFPGLHFGVWRSAIKTVRQARLLVKQIQALKHVKIEAFMGYEAQIAGLGDTHSLTSPLIRKMKARSYQELASRRAAVVKAIQEEGIELKVVNGGGTGSLELTSSEACITEVTAGSGFYSPTLFDHYQGFKHLPAAGFAIPVVRQPRSNIYTCLGGGYIASGAAGVDRLPSVYLPEGAHLMSLEGAGEVQTPIKYKGQLKLTLGDPIFMRHSKAGELCERFNSLYLLQDGTIIDEVKTYRGEGKCFL